MKRPSDLPEKIKTITWDEANRNLLNVPTTWLEPKEEDVEIFNQAYFATKDYPDFLRTRSGGISKNPLHFRYYQRILDIGKASVGLYVVEPQRCYKLVFRRAYKSESEGDELNLSGGVAFGMFRRRLKRASGRDLLAENAIANGKEIKKTIPAPDIRLNQKFKDVAVENAFHVDINSAYMSGICKKFGDLGDGVFREVVEDIYEHRHDGTPSTRYNKSIFNCAQGFMQSRWCILPVGEDGKKYGYALSHFSKAGIEDCKKRLSEIIKLYEDLGCELVGTNTDGAWMVPSSPEEFDIEKLRDVPGYGNRLGEFRIDHWNCLLRFRSVGAYEYIENGLYNPVVRGRTRLDFIKPRTEWEWGDIYQEDAKPIRYAFTKEYGIELIEED